MPAAEKAETVEHEGFTIQPSPARDGSGWRVQGSISKEIDGELRTYEFIRADTCTDRQDAINTTVMKARRIVDEQGERMFERD